MTTNADFQSANQPTDATPDSETIEIDIDQATELVAFGEVHEWQRPLPSEALYSFAGWLTGRNEAVTFSANHEAGIAAELVNAFCKANDFDSPRDGIWPGNVKHPPAADGGQPHDH